MCCWGVCAVSEGDEALVLVESVLVLSGGGGAFVYVSDQRHRKALNDFCVPVFRRGWGGCVVREGEEVGVLVADVVVL